jgi:branched-chain amino acid transport system substrate-binding protein
MLDRRKSLRVFAAAAWLLGGPALAQTPAPITIGLALSLTGATAPAGRQVLAGLEIWRDDVNAKGGLLGRPVKLVYYDD